MVEKFIKKLKNSNFEGEIRNDEKTLDIFSRDASVFLVKPELVISPKNVFDVEKAITCAGDVARDGEKISFGPRSAGTDMSGGTLTESVSLDMQKNFEGILNVDDKEMTVDVLPGTFYRDLEKKLDEYDLLLPSYTASKELCALGGMVMNNSGGEKTLSYGKTADYIKTLHIVLADGNEYEIRPISSNMLASYIGKDDFLSRASRSLFEMLNENKEEIEKAKPHVTKNSSGYALWDVYDGHTFDLTKLFCGSQGTLGILTKARLSLVHKKKFTKLVVIFLKDLVSIPEIVSLTKPFNPETLESYDDHTFKMSVRFMPELAKQMKGRKFLSLLWSFWPELIMIIKGGVPKMVVLAEFSDDNQDNLVKRVRGAVSAIRGSHELKGVTARVVPTEIEAEKYWAMRRESFNLLRKHVKGKRTAPFIDDFAVHPDKLPEFMPKLYEILDKYNLTYTIAGHIGDGNFHIIPLMKLKDDKSVEIIEELSKKVYELIVEYGGTITAEHNDGIIRTPFLPYMYSPKIIQLFAKVKEIFDPAGIFNPGKKVGIDKEYMISHIDRSI